jgi:hypothetical protein
MQRFPRWLIAVALVLAFVAFSFLMHELTSWGAPPDVVTQHELSPKFDLKRQMILPGHHIRRFRVFSTFQVRSVMVETNGPTVRCALIDASAFSSEEFVAAFMMASTDMQAGQKPDPKGLIWYSETANETFKLPWRPARRSAQYMLILVAKDEVTVTTRVSYK